MIIHVDVGGLGDTLRSIFAYFVYCKLQNIDYYVSFDKHPFNLCFNMPNYKPTPEDKFYFFNCPYTERQKLTDLHNFIENNKHLNYIIRTSIFDFISFKQLRNNNKEFLQFLNVTPLIKQNVEQQLLTHNLKDKKFCSIHVRCGDFYMINNSHSDNRITLNTAIDKIKSIITNNPTELFILFTDNYELREHFEAMLITLDTTIGHTGINPNEQAVVDSVTEFFIMGRSEKIITLSKSGFSFWSAFINNVPLYNENMEPIETI